MLTGSIVALVTPMHLDGSIDYPALNSLIEWHITEGTNAIVIAGTTGEASTLETPEHIELISHAVKQANRRIAIIAGTGNNATQSTIYLTQAAQKSGANACLLIAPYYNKPTQEGFYQHFSKIAESCAIPLILYNNPSRTGSDLLPQTVAKLANKHTSIIGIKDATGDINRYNQLREHAGDFFGIYSGDDPTALEWMSHGAQGVISITANIAPEQMRTMCDAVLMKNLEQAALINNELADLHLNLCIESNPIPAKWVLSHMGKIKPGIRLPLTPLSPQYHAQLIDSMEKAGIMIEV